MFSRISATNFKCFDDITIDLCERKNHPKKLAIFYGSNSSGKTTIAELFYILKRTMDSMEVKGVIDDLLVESINSPDDFPIKQDALMKLLKARMAQNSIESIIKEYKTIDSTQHMCLSYDFVINNHAGTYYIEFDNTSIVKESLHYTLEKRKGCYFDIEEEKVQINPRIFETKEFSDSVTSQVIKYWGKHSFLSILLFEMSDKSDTFVNENISNNLMNILLMFSDISYRFIDKSTEPTDNNILNNISVGEVSINEENTLKQVEIILSKIFKKIYTDIVDVFYERRYIENTIRYKLMFKRKMGNKTIKVDFSKESSGTRELIKLIPCFAAAISGKCVVIDEYGTKIHDLLSSKLLESIFCQLKGQLILTTHNTMILENKKISSDAYYFILDTPAHQKQVKCITDLEDRLYANYNYRSRYLSGKEYNQAKPDFENLTELAKYIKALPT